MQRQLIPVLILGLSIGVLAGMSGSPVSSTLLASLLAVATLALSVIGGFQQSAAENTEQPPRRVDISTLSVFSLAIVLAVMPASWLRSEIVKNHQDQTIARQLSPPKALEDIVSAWHALEPNTTRQAITDTVLARYTGITAADDESADVSADTPILLSTSTRSSLEKELEISCAKLPACASDMSNPQDCLSNNFITARRQTLVVFSALARALNTSHSEISIEQSLAHAVFEEFRSDLCEDI